MSSPSTTSSDLLPPVDDCPFQPNEKILAFHQDFIYEAKILRIRIAERTSGRGKWQYFIHYQGWKERWDEWVDEVRILKHNEENLQLRQSLRARYSKKKPKTSQPTKTKTSKTLSTSNTTPKSQLHTQQQNGNNGSIHKISSSHSNANMNPSSNSQSFLSSSLSHSLNSSQDGDRGFCFSCGSFDCSCSSSSSSTSYHSSFNTTPSVFPSSSSLVSLSSLTLAPSLKRILVQESNLISKKNLVALPRYPCVSEILSDFLFSCRERGEVDDSTQETVQLFEVFFHYSIGKFLLYKFERPQYSDIYQKQVRQLEKEIKSASESDNKHNNISGEKPISDEKEKTQRKRLTLSEYYGAEHLLRLIVKLPDIIGLVSIDEYHTAALTRTVGRLLEYLSRNRESLFAPTSSYEPVLPVYLRMAENL